MISLENYFGKKDHTEAQEEAAEDLLHRVEMLLLRLKIEPPMDPDTGCQISGSKGGSGDGGFRLPTSSTGSPHSAHKEAKAVDVYDPLESLDFRLNQYEDAHGGNLLLEEFGLYREAPESTKGWCHLTTRAPKSGKRTFLP